MMSLLRPSYSSIVQPFVSKRWITSIPFVIEASVRTFFPPNDWFPVPERNGPIDDDVAGLIVAQLLYLDADNSDKPISLYINSPGGSVTSGMGIYDTMQFIKSPISTLCIGQASSMGSLLLAAGKPGRRYALPNSRIMIHQPSGGAQGQASDIAIQAREIIRWRTQLNEIYRKHTKMPIELIEQKMERDSYMTAEEAREYGLVDTIIESNSPSQDESKKDT